MTYMDRLRETWEERACFICGRCGRCRHRELKVDLAELALLDREPAPPRKPAQQELASAIGRKRA